MLKKIVASQEEINQTQFRFITGFQPQWNAQLNLHYSSDSSLTHFSEEPQFLKTESECTA